MKKLTDLKEGELLTNETAAALIKQPDETIEQAVKRLRKWREHSAMHPDRYPRSAKIGGTVYWLKSHLLEFLNREFNKAS